MSYTPTIWNTGDVVTAQKLNNIEQGIKGNETIFVDAIWANYISESNIVNINMDANAVVAAVEVGKDVKVRLGHSSAGDITYEWIAQLIYYQGMITPANQRICTFAVPHIVGAPIAPCAIHIDYNGIDYQFSPDYALTYENVSVGLKWNNMSSPHYEYQVPMFYNDNYCGVDWDTVENIVDFGTTGAELIQAARAGAETQKTTLSAVYDDGEGAGQVYSVLTSAFSGTAYIMFKGRGSLLKLMLPSDQYLLVRCVSSCSDGGANVCSTFEGYLPTSVTESGGTISGVNLYKITLDLYAERTGDGNQTPPYEYKAVATVSVEKIPSTIVPMS